MNIDDIADIVLDTFKDIIENLTMPTGKNLLPSFLVSIGITVVSVVVTVLDKVPLIDWRGALIASVALGILVFIERRGIDEVSRLYRAAKSGVGTIAQRAKGTNPGDETDGSDDPCDILPTEDNPGGGTDDTV